MTLLRLAVLLAVFAPAVAAQEPEPWGVMEVWGSPKMLAEAANWPSADLSRVRIVRELLRYFLTDGSDEERATAQEGRTRLVDTLERVQNVHSLSRALKIDHQPQSLENLMKAAPAQLHELARALDLELVGGQLRDAARPGLWSIRDALVDAGIDVEGVIRQANAGGAFSLRVPTFMAPLPLGREYWTHEMLKLSSGNPDIFSALLRKEEHALFYIGLIGLDPGTLAFFRANPRLLGLARANSWTFAEFSSSFRVREGRLDIPLSRDAHVAWEAVVSRSPDDTVGFLSALLEKHQGRLAWFFDTVVRLPEPKQRFALSTAFGVDETRERARSTFERFNKFSSEARALRRFRRAGFDPALAFSTISVDAVGKAMMPNSTFFMRTLLDDANLIGRVENPPAARDAADMLTADRYLEILFNDRNGSSEHIARAYAFAQRIWTVGGQHWGGMERVIRSALHFPSLFATLDRMGVTNTTVLIDIAARAMDFREQGRQQFTAASLLQLQAAILLIQQMGAAGSIPEIRVRQLIGELAEHRLPSRGSYHGALLDWFFSQLETGFSGLPLTAPGDTYEEKALVMLSGGNVRRSVQAFAADGVEYVFDPTRADRHRVFTIREQQNVAKLDDLRSFMNLAQKARDARAPEDLKSALDELEKVAPRLLALVPHRLEVAQSFSKTVQALRRVQRSLRDLDNQTPSLMHVLDWFGAYALLSLAYAAAMPEPSLTPALAEVWRAHDLGLGRDTLREQDELPWELPVLLAQDSAIARECRSNLIWSRCQPRRVPSRNTPVRVEGSVLALDTALVVTVLKREGGLGQQRVHEADTNAIWQAAARMRPAGQDHASTQETVAAIEKGKRLLAATSFDAGRLPSWRYAALDWVRRHEPDIADRLPLLSELAFLGGISTERLSAWGAPSVSADGCFCLRMPEPYTVDAYANYAGSGLAALLTSELRLALGVATVRDELPGDVIPVIFRHALVERVNRTVAGDAGDWLPLAALFNSVSRSDVGAYFVEMQQKGVLTHK